jgi:hypothetical protein
MRGMALLILLAVLGAGVADYACHSPVLTPGDAASTLAPTDPPFYGLCSGSDCLCVCSGPGCVC